MIPDIKYLIAQAYLVGREAVSAHWTSLSGAGPVTPLQRRRTNRPAQAGMCSGGKVDHWGGREELCGLTSRGAVIWRLGVAPVELL